MATQMAPAPARLLLPMRIVDPACPATSISSASLGSGASSHLSLSLFLHPHRYNFYRGSRSVSARIVQVEESSPRFDREPGRESSEGSNNGRAQQKRYGRGGSRPWNGQRETGRVPPWKTQTRFRQSQPSTGRERDEGAAEHASDSRAQHFQRPAVEQDDEMVEDRPRSFSSSEDARESYPLNSNARSQVFGGARNERRAPWQHVIREGRNRLNPGAEEDAGAEEGSEVGDGESKQLNVQGEKSAMARIVEKLRSIQKISGTPEQEGQPRRSLTRTPGSIFLPKANQDLFSISKDWSTPDHPVPEPGKGILDTRFPWERDEEAEAEEKVEKMKRVKPPSLAELTIPQPELKRLRSLALHVKQRLKIGRLGVTDSIAQGIRERFRTCEVVKVKCEGPPALNMKKTHQELERKTGGLVIWRAGSAAVVYRGKDYGQPMTNGENASSLDIKLEGFISSEDGESEYAKDEDSEVEADEKDDEAGKEDTEVETPETISKSKAATDPPIDREYEMEVDNILEDLGPRYEGWTGLKPVPVDGDLLPPTIPNYSPPFRLLPYGVRPNLSNAELTNLRRLARPLPPHFVLGRNRGQQGLATAMVKLWEKSEIAKIAVKRGVQNTNNERMAEELKRLTGGVLLARDKEFITFYRGKDFLPQAVAAALVEREAMVRSLQEAEESARAEKNIPVQRDAELEQSMAGTLGEAPDVKPTWQTLMDSEEQKKLKREAAKARRLELARRIERKLAVALKKKEKAQIDLEKVEEFLKPSDPPADQETITEEERFMFRKLGLRMKAFLLVGRRGVFDGVVENMHLHWKHRELVKLIIKEKDPVQLQETAKMLEYESGGILVAVIATSKGQAIIVYRGKNYTRPAQLRPKNLLTKRKALKRSLEIQRRASLSRHILALEQEIDKMKAGLSKMEEDEHTESAEDSNENSGASFTKDLEIKSDAAPHEDDSQSYGNFEDMRRGVTVGAEDEATGRGLSENEVTTTIPISEREKLRRLSKLGPVYRAEPLTNRERLKLRKEALNLSKAAHFHVGKSNVVKGLAKAIRVYLQQHALVKIGVKGRARGTSIQELVHELENTTGAVLVSQEASKIILYRGWPDGEEMPSSDFYDELSPELRSALEAEDDDDWIDDPADVSGDELEVSDDEGDEEEEDQDYIVGMHSDVDDDEETLGFSDDEEEGTYDFLEEDDNDTTLASFSDDDQRVDGDTKDLEWEKSELGVPSQEFNDNLEEGDEEWMEAGNVDAHEGMQSMDWKMEDEGYVDAHGGNQSMDGKMEYDSKIIGNGSSLSQTHCKAHEMVDT